MVIVVLAQALVLFIWWRNGCIGDAGGMGASHAISDGFGSAGGRICDADGMGGWI